VPARNDTERFILAAMEEVLKLPGLGVQHDFFALGAFPAGGPTDGADQPSFRDQPAAERTVRGTGRGAAGAHRGRLAEDRAVRAQADHGPARAADRASDPTQEWVRFVQDLNPERLLYNTPSAHRLRGPMDLVAFEKALKQIIHRQPALRSRLRDPGFAADHRPALDFELPLVDLSSELEAAREQVLMQRMQEVVDTPIDIHRAPLFRAILYRMAQDEHVLLFMPHHIVWDGWSFDLFYSEMAALYPAYLAGREDPLPPLAVTYGDYADWYLQWLNSAEAEKQLTYWRQRFAKIETPVMPWTDFPRQGGMTGAGVTEWVTIDAATTARLRTLARGADVTLNMLGFRSMRP
jgi:hypothetical protein